MRPGISSGLFAVTKDLVKDRLILDGREPNVYEVPLNKWTRALAAAEKVAGSQLLPDEIWLCSGRDLRDYFYQLQISWKRLSKNCLSGTLRPQEVEEIFGKKVAKSRAHVGLNTLAMRDCSACEFAQGVHLGVLYSSQVFEGTELNTLVTPVPRGLSQVGVIIDDLMVLERISAGWLRLPEPRQKTDLMDCEVSLGPRLPGCGLSLL